MHKLYCEKESLTLGQLYLLDICDKRQITAFWKNQLQCELDVSRLINLATGAVPLPSLRIIYLMLPYVEPAKWFYTAAEYYKKYEIDHFKDCKYTEDWKESINYVNLVKMYEERTLWNYCEKKFNSKDINIKNMYIRLMHLVKGRNNLTIGLIKDFEPGFLLENWFIK